MNTISAVYKIINTITGDFYIGSSKNVKQRWTAHKSPSRWKQHPNSQLYKDMQKYGVDKFVFEILTEAKAEQLKEIEQEFIEKLKPAYNDRNANGLDVEREKEYNKEYNKSEKYKESQKKYKKKYQNQLCYFNGETLTLNALRMRFAYRGIPHPTLEAKKYLMNKDK